jgi:lipopolysaccharide export system protein LptA
MAPRPCVALRGALLLAGLALAGGAALAERADRDQPLQFDAGQLRLDGKKRIKQLSGGVEIRRGTLVIRAAEVELRETPQGESAQALGTPAQPATFEQKRDGVDERIEGQAQRIEYDASTETVRFLGQARVRLLRAGVVADEISGQTITYDQARDAFEVQGGAPGTAGNGRVRGVVTPRPSGAAASAAGGTAR